MAMIEAWEDFYPSSPPPPHPGHLLVGAPVHDTPAYPINHSMGTGDEGYNPSEHIGLVVDEAYITVAKRTAMMYLKSVKALHAQASATGADPRPGFEQLVLAEVDRRHMIKLADYSWLVYSTQEAVDTEALRIALVLAETWAMDDITLRVSTMLATNMARANDARSYIHVRDDGSTKDYRRYASSTWWSLVVVFALVMTLCITNSVQFMIDGYHTIPFINLIALILASGIVFTITMLTATPLKTRSP